MNCKNYNNYSLLICLLTLVPSPIYAKNIVNYYQYKLKDNQNICSSPKAINIIGAKFKHKLKYELKTITPKSIKYVKNIKLTQYNKATNTKTIDRWFCKAEAVLDDNQKYPIYYLIEQINHQHGLKSHNVEFCIESFDPKHVYNGFCRTLRPHNLNSKFIGINKQNY